TRRLSLLPILFSTIALVAQAHPNFTGKWKLNVAKSDSRGVTELVADVDHKDPVLKYVVQGVANGERFQESESITTDGNTSRDSHGVNVKASWDGADLVIAGTADDNSMVYLVRLSLSSDGKTITRVFTQKEDPEPRHEIYEKQ
ncbi:MAG TPA: hypothetical protein VJ731_05260, partial [Terriglobales bacterium]|nr:hypothetical protein [Terriglobales bacterium]